MCTELIIIVPAITYGAISAVCVAGLATAGSFLFSATFFGIASVTRVALGILGSPPVLVYIGSDIPFALVPVGLALAKIGIVATSIFAGLAVIGAVLSIPAMFLIAGIKTHG